MEPSKELVDRAAAAQATLDRFKDKPFRLGSFDCVRMTAAHLRRLGYQVKLPATGSYRSKRKALELLNESGAGSLAAALDQLGLERIAPAAAIVGDIIQMPSVDELGALTVSMGNGRVLGYHEAAVGACVMQPKDFGSAWRARPKI
jgi:hypothetical protein